MQRSCVNHPDNFCYICGDVTLKSQRKTLTPLICKSYELYFGRKVGEQDKSWAPHICCATCAVLLMSWLRKKPRHMAFAVPVVWTAPTDHSSDCYFCMTKITGISSKLKNCVQYPNIPSVIRPVPHSKELPIPMPPETWSLDTESAHHADVKSEEISYNPDVTERPSEPHRVSQADLNSLAHDMNLSKAQSELLTSRLKGWNLVQKKSRVSSSRRRR